MSRELEDLIYVMRRLRDSEDGCPWDLKQSWTSILPSTIEEAYEVADAIEGGDFAAVREELGDLLFQVVFYARLGEEEGRFGLRDIMADLAAKLVRRHPHVFPDGNMQSRRQQAEPDEAQIKSAWESTKQAEREAKGQSDLFDDVPLNFPALTRAHKLQKRAANLGFDWHSVEPVFAKVSEELEEVRAEFAAGDHEALEREIGDLLFSVVNLSRHLQVDAESALRRCSRRFQQRMAHMQQQLAEQGLSLGEVSAQQLERAWEKAKVELADNQS